LYYNLRKISGENGIILVFISTIFQLHRDASHSGKKDWTSVLAPMESILKGIKCFFRNVNTSSFLKKILFFWVNKSAYAGMGQLNPERFGALGTRKGLNPNFHKHICWF
jgi:hypothetical protein